MTKQGRWFRKLRRMELACWKLRLGKPPSSNKTLRKLVRNISRYTICWNGRVFKRNPASMTVQEIQHRLFQGWTKRRTTPKRQRHFERWMSKTKP